MTASRNTITVKPTPQNFRMEAQRQIIYQRAYERLTKHNHDHNHNQCTNFLI